MDQSQDAAYQIPGLNKSSWSVCKTITCPCPLILVAWYSCSCPSYLPCLYLFAPELNTVQSYASGMISAKTPLAIVILNYHFHFSLVQKYWNSLDSLLDETTKSIMYQWVKTHGDEKKFESIILWTLGKSWLVIYPNPTALTFCKH